MIVNADKLVAGRLASIVAKKIIKGEEVVVINSEKSIIVGTFEAIMPKYKMKVNASVLSNPHFGPKYDRVPSKMFRRMVKGMLPNKNRTSERLIKNLKVFNLGEHEVDISKAETIQKIKCNEKHDFMTLGEVASALGGKW